MPAPTATMARTMAETTSAGTAELVLDLRPGDRLEPVTIQSPKMRTPPTAASDPSTISGVVITRGDSCGVTSGRHRLLPKNVISITRVM